MGPVGFDSGAASLAPAAVAVPIALAAVLLVAARRLPRLAVDAVATAAAGAVVVIDAVLLHFASAGRVVTWAGGWKPGHGFTVGIVLVADPLGAGIALLAGALVVLALVFSWRYIEGVEGHFHCLMLLFLAGMEGFALTGDLFDLFVFFELMGAAAYALTGVKVEDPTSVQGGMNFGIVNSLGAYIALMGVGILYARTGRLGLPQLGATLAASHHRDALVVAAFVMLMAGFLVKGAMVPFHFWLADAHAVAPSPVCVLFSGVMVPLGVYAAFRVYEVVFAASIAPADVRRAFMVFGALTALTGATMCLAQRNLKRLLAYSTIGHVGLFLLALGTLSGPGVAGAAVYIASHAGAKAALFLSAGIVLARYGSVDEAGLHGRARDAGAVRWLVVAAALALACLPPFGTALGKALSEDAGSAAGYGWVPVVFVAVSAMTGGAVLRFGARVFFGLGPRPDETGGETSGEEERETPAMDRVPLSMLVPVEVLLAGCLAVGVLPGLHRAVERAAEAFVDGPGYISSALAGPASARLAAAAPVGDWKWSGVLLGLLSAALAVGVAAAGVWSPTLIRRLAGPVKAGRRVLGVLRDLHSGHVGDYVAWLFLGLAALAGFVGLPGR